MTGSIEINGAVCSIPRNWEECSPVLVKQLAAILHGPDMAIIRKKEEQEGIAAKDEAYVIVCRLLLHRMVAHAPLAFIREYLQLRPEHVAMVLQGDDNPVKFCFTGGPVTNPTPWMRVWFRKWIGPRELLKGVTYGEYLYAHELYKAWTQTGKKELLLRMWATLYRVERTDVERGSAKWHTDQRKEFIPEVVGYRAQKLHHLDDATLLGLVQFWKGVHERWRGEFPYVFRGTGRGAADAGSALLALAGGPLPGQVEQAAKALVSSVLKDNNDRLRQREEDRLRSRR